MFKKLKLFGKKDCVAKKKRSHKEGRVLRGERQ